MAFGREEVNGCVWDGKVGKVMVVIEHAVFTQMMVGQHTR